MNDGTGALRDELQAIYEANGELTPTLLVDTARDPNHPLHHRFEWDDSAAAEKWRLEQGAQLIRSVRIAFTSKTGQPSDLRAFTAVRGKDTPTANYMPTEEVVSDPFYRALVLRDMDRDWRSFKRRYEHLAEFADRFGQVAG